MGSFSFFARIYDQNISVDFLTSGIIYKKTSKKTVLNHLIWLISATDGFRSGNAVLAIFFCVECRGRCTECGRWTACIFVAAEVDVQFWLRLRCHFCLTSHSAERANHG